MAKKFQEEIKMTREIAKAPNILVNQASDVQIEALQNLLYPSLRYLIGSHAEVLINNGSEFQEMFNCDLKMLLGKLVVGKTIEACKFNSIDITLPFEQFPLREEPIDSVEEMRLDETLSTHKLQQWIDSANKRYASPITALRFAAKYPKKQESYEMAVIFEAIEEPWYLVLDGRYGRRKVRVRNYRRVVHWHEGCYFLVVPK